MTKVTENDIRQINGKIDKLTETVTQLAIGQSKMTQQITLLGDNLGGQINSLNGQITSIDKKLATVETRLEDWKPSIDKIADLSEKVGEIKNWKQVGLVIITAFISSILSGSIGGVIGWFIKSAK
jgi:uncharacterized coiled-coil DUF342 family protein